MAASECACTHARLFRASPCQPYLFRVQACLMPSGIPNPASGSQECIQYHAVGAAARRAGVHYLAPHSAIAVFASHAHWAGMLDKAWWMSNRRVKPKAGAPLDVDRPIIPSRTDGGL